MRVGVASNRVQWAFVGAAFLVLLSVCLPGAQGFGQSLCEASSGVPSSFEVEPNDSPFLADWGGTIPGAFCFEAEISEGNEDYFAFDVASPTDVVIETHLFGSGDTILTLLDADGGELASNDDAPDGTRRSRIEECLSRGLYYVVVEDFRGEDSFPYALVVKGSMPCGSPAVCGLSEVEDNDSMGRADWGGPIPGAFCWEAEIVEGNEDYFAFEVPSSMLVEIRTELFGTGDTTLTLLLGTGEVVATNDDDPDGGTHSVIEECLPPGQYYVAVRSFHETASFPYVLSVESGEPCGQPDPTSLSILLPTWSDDVDRAIDGAVDGFATSSDIEVSVERVGSLADTTAIAMAMAASGQLPPILWGDAELIASLAQYGAIAPLDDLVVSHPDLIAGLPPEALETFSFEGTLYGVSVAGTEAHQPFSTSGLAVSSDALAPAATNAVATLLQDLIDVVAPFAVRVLPETLLVGEFTIRGVVYDDLGTWDSIQNVHVDVDGAGWVSFDLCPSPAPPIWLIPGTGDGSISVDTLNLTTLPLDVVVQVTDPSTQISIADASVLFPGVALGDTVDVRLVGDGSGPLDPASAIGAITVDPSLFLVDGDLRVVFENVTIQEEPFLEKTGSITQGAAIYDASVSNALPAGGHTWEDEGFTVRVSTLVLTPTLASGQVSLMLPNRFWVADTSPREPIVLDLGVQTLHPDCRVHAVLPNTTFGDWAIGGTDFVISGTGLVADLDPSWTYPGQTGKPTDGTWVGLILLQGSKHAAALPSGETMFVSNRGYLGYKYAFLNQVGFPSFLDRRGLTARLWVDGGGSFRTVVPAGFEVTTADGFVDLADSRVKGGALWSATVRAPLDAVHNGKGKAVTGYCSTLAIDVTTEHALHGYIELQTDLRWGDRTAGGAGDAYGLHFDAISADSGYFLIPDSHENPFLPVDASGAFRSYESDIWADLQSKTPRDVRAWVLKDRIHGITAQAYDAVGSASSQEWTFEILTPDIPTGNSGGSLKWWATDFTWLNIAGKGVHGVVAAKLQAPALVVGPTYNLTQYPANENGVREPFETVLSIFDSPGRHNAEVELWIEYVSSAVHTCENSGKVELEGPAEAMIPFEDLQFTSTADIVAAKVIFDEPIVLKYWDLELVQKPAHSAAGVFSPRMGRIILTASGLRERLSEPSVLFPFDPKKNVSPHFSQPFWLTWGTILADGDWDDFIVDYNTVGMRFDGFPYTYSHMRLSSYYANPKPSPNPSGYLETAGRAGIDVFGEAEVALRDYYDMNPGTPHYNRRIELLPGMTPVVDAVWGHRSQGDPFADFTLLLQYDTDDQDGFVARHRDDPRLDVFDPSYAFSTAGFAFFDKDTPVSAVVSSDRICLSVSENKVVGVLLDGVLDAEFFNAQNFAGCLCVQSGSFRRMSLAGEVQQVAAVTALIRSTQHSSFKLSTSPSRSELWMDGGFILNVLTGVVGDLDVRGAMHTIVDFDADSLEVEIDGKVDASAFLGTYEMVAEGKLNWFESKTNAWIQGRASIEAIAASMFGAKAEGGFFLGFNADRSEIWVLDSKDVADRIKFPTDALPSQLTGVFGYVRFGKSINLWVIGGGYEVYFGLGAFLSLPNWDEGVDFPKLVALKHGTWSLPEVVGRLGIHLWGEILGGLVSASGWGDVQLTAGSKDGKDVLQFDGTLGLRGCVLFLCASVDVDFGLGTEGFYIK